MYEVNKSESSSVVSNSLRSHGLYNIWNSPGQNTGVGSLSLLQRIFPTQGSNPGLLHCRWILYQLSHKGSPRILEWVAYPFSSGSSRPRNQTGITCIAGRFFTNWAMREVYSPQGCKESDKMYSKFKYAYWSFTNPLLYGIRPNLLPVFPYFCLLLIELYFYLF